MKRRSRTTHWRSGLLLVLLSLAVAESGLHLASRVTPRLRRVVTPAWALQPDRPDPDLIVAGNPAWPGHDSNGFRNPRVADRADIVALGDSHTYGGGVQSDDAWPRILAVGTGLSVYNMAFPGWGAGQAWLVLDRAMALHPRLIVFGLYFGNDFYDAFRLVSMRPDLAATEPVLRDSAFALEVKAPIGQRVEYLFEMGDTATTHAGPAWAVRQFLSRNSELYALLRAGLNIATGRDARTPAALARDLDAALRGMTEEQRKFVEVYRDSEWSTLLTPEYRNLVLDISDARIRLGLEASEELIARMDSTTRAHGIDFLVVLLPTKESVFVARMQPSERSDPLARLVTNESRSRDELKQVFEARGIHWLDALPLLQTSKAQPYFPDADGHPNELGHRLIADAVARRIEKIRDPAGSPMRQR